MNKNILYRNIPKVDVLLENPRIVKLIKKYPEFTVMYEHIYNICRNVEGMMEMYSAELN